MQITYIPYTMNYYHYHYQLSLFCRLKNATFTFAAPCTQSEISDMETKTCITILLLLVASSCPYVLSCIAKNRTAPKQIEGAKSNALQKEHNQWEGIRNDTNRHLQNIVNDVNRTLGELVLRVGKVGEAIDEKIMSPLTSILNNANVIVKNANTAVDIWIVLLLLSGFFVSRYLRLRTGNDFVSCCEYFILSILELIFLNGAVVKLIVTLHKFIVGEDSEQKILDETLPGAGVLNENERLLNFMITLNVLIIVIFGTLRLVRKIDVKAVLSIFLWPLLQKKISVGLRALLFLFVIVASVFLYYSTSSIFASILCFLAR